MKLCTLSSLLLIAATIQTTTAFVAGHGRRQLTAFVTSSSTSSTSTTTLLHAIDVDKMSLEDMRKLFLDGVDKSEVDVSDLEEGAMEPLIALTEDNAIKITGYFNDTSSEGDCSALKRYTKMHELTGEQVQQLFAHSNAKIIAKGVGEEWYEIPEDGKTTAETEYSSEDAVKEALKVAESVNGAKRVVFNVFGGDDLVFSEVSDALETLVKKLDGIPEKATILFNSMAHEIVEEETCWLTVVAMDDIDGDVLPEGLTGPLKNAAEGEVYFARGKYWTTSEDDAVTEQDYDPVWWENNVVNPDPELLQRVNEKTMAGRRDEDIQKAAEEFIGGYGE